MLACQRKKLPRQGAVKKNGKVLNLETKEGLREYRSRTWEMSDRQKELCAICGYWMLRPTFDHEAGRGAGKRDDRIVDDGGNWINAAVHEHCNCLKGSKRYKWVNGVYKPVEKYREVA